MIIIAVTEIVPILARGPEKHIMIAVADIFRGLTLTKSLLTSGVFAKIETTITDIKRTRPAIAPVAASGAVRITAAITKFIPILTRRLVDEVPMTIAEMVSSVAGPVCILGGIDHVAVAITEIVSIRAGKVRDRVLPPVTE